MKGKQSFGENAFKKYTRNPLKNVVLMCMAT